MTTLKKFLAGRSIKNGAIDLLVLGLPASYWLVRRWKQGSHKPNKAWRALLEGVDIKA